MQIIQGGIVYVDGRFQEGLNLLIEQEKIVDITGEQASSDGNTIDAGGSFVAPGFIDIHTHGCNGADTMDGTVEAIQAMSAFWPAHGTTSFLPTTMTADAQSIQKSISAVFQAMKMPSGADILGINLEGPFLCPRAKGAHMEELIVNPSVPFYESMLPDNMDIVRIVTVAPDAPDAEKLICYLQDNGVVASIGHTTATYEQCQVAFKSGARHCTHFYNAMSPLKHREPGVVGALLENEDATIELIADLIHVHPAALKLAYRLKDPSHIALITDSTVATGLKDGKYICGGLEVSVQKGSVRLSDGTLAGSILTLDQALRNMTKTGIPMEGCIPMLTETPARVAGAGGYKGRIAKGYDADLVILDKDLVVKGTMVKGIWRYGFQGD